MIDWELESGDLLIFDGTSKISKAIKFFTRGQFSHVGLVWRCPTTKKLYVWENGSPSKSSYPIITKKGADHDGAHLTPLRKRFKSLNGNVFVRRLIRLKSKTTDFDTKYTEFITENLGRPYKSDFVACWNQITGISLMHLPFMEERDPDCTSWWCGELVLYTYKHLGVIEDVFVPFHYILPSEFTDIDTTDNLVISENFAFMELENLCINKN